MSQEEPIILHPRNNSFELVIPLVLFSTLFTVTFLISVVDVRWDVVVISLILLAIPITIISEFYKKIYVFYSNKLVIESCKNKYLDEIRIEDIVSWNEHSTQRKGKSRYYLLIKAAGKNLFIERGSYENYKAVIEYLRNSPIPVDKSLKPGAIIIDDLVIPLKKNIIVAFILSATLTLFTFWMIVKEKSDSNEIIHFIGKIEDIGFRRSHTSLYLKGYPNLIFKTYTNGFFSQYYYNGGNSKLVNLGKTIDLSVMKSDYDWLVKNKFIRKIQWSSDISLEVEEFKILD